MSTELTNDITISLDDITVEEVKSTDTITTSSLTVDTQAPETTVEATKKEYSIVGDGIYASVSTEDAPVWLISIVESVVNNAVANGMTDYDLLVQDVRNAIDSIDIAQNTYVQQVNFDSLVNGLIGSQLETLNATIGNTYATKTELSTVVATTDAALAQNVTDLTASFTSEINSRITAVETAYSDADQAIASDVTALTAAYANQASDIEGAASAITGLQTYVGVDENNIPNSTGVLSRLSILEAQNDGVVEVITGTHDVMLGIEDPNTDTSNDGLDVTAEPYATWIAADTAAGNEEVRASHIGDVYIKYDPVGNTYLASYKFIKTVIDTTDPYATDAKGYTWAIVSDSEAASVYILALNAYDLADGKRRIFVAQPTSGPYDVGDLWLVAVGDAIIGQTINGRVVQAGDILRAAVAKTDQGAYSISHWAFASNYTNDQYAIDIENGTRQIDLGDHVNSLGWTDDSTVDNFITVTYAQDRIDIGEQIDGKATTYFQGTEPYAFDDLSEVERQANEGDVWYDTTPVSGIEAYRFSATTGWELIRDTQTLQALADASTAQATADGRIRNFTQQPFAPYSVGDTWMQGATGDIFVCNTDNLDGAFNQAHWVLASNYTDDTAVTELSNGLADGTVVINLSSATVDGVTSIADFVGGELDNQVVVYSGTAIADAPTDARTNDLFIESREVTSGTDTYTETTIYRWNGDLIPAQWVAQTNASSSIADLADLADGKRTIFSNPSDDVPAGETNDLWFPATGTDDQTYIPGEVYQYNGTSWVLATTYTENLQDFVNNVVNTIVPSLESQIDGKIEYWFTTSDNDPSDNWAEDRYGDIWYQTDTNLSYYYTDVGGVGTWVAISDADALAAIEAAADAQGAADGRVSQFYAWGGSEAPADYVVGGNTIPASNYAYWYKTDGNLYYKPDTVWVTVPITASQTGTTYLSLGDLLTVFDPTELDYTYYYFNGTAWQQNGPSGIISNSKFFVDLDAAVNGPNGIAQAQSDLEISVDTYARSLDNATLSGLSAVDVGWTTDETATAVESDASPIAGCQPAMTYAQAVAYAQSIGLRLPTVAEIQSGLGQGTGCGFDNQFIWTSNKGITEGTYYVIKGNYTSTNDIEERSATSTAYIRLAADSHDKLTSASLFAQSKFEYNAPVTINGVTRNAGFGLVNERSSVLNKPLAGFSEFWVAADKFKIVNPNDTSKYAVFSTNLDGSLSLGTNFTEATRNAPAGAYSAVTSYIAGDTVTYNGSSYTALVNLTGVTPTDDGVNWQLLAARGDDGVNTNTVRLHQSTNSLTPPTTPSEDLTYNFTTGELSGDLGFWTTSVLDNICDDPDLTTTDGKGESLGGAPLSIITHGDPLPDSPTAIRCQIDDNGDAGFYTNVGNNYQFSEPLKGRKFNFRFKVRGSVAQGDIYIGFGVWDGNAYIYPSKNTGVNLTTSFQEVEAEITFGSELSDDFFSVRPRLFVNNSVDGNTVDFTDFDVYETTQGRFLWVTQALASSITATDTIVSNEWATPVTTGYLSVDGINSRPLFLYNKSSNSSQPTLFSGTATYVFSTDTLSGLTLNNWTREAPTLNDGEQLWMSQATALSTTDSDTISFSEWSTPAITGIAGVGVASVDKVGSTVTVSYTNGSSDNFTVNGISSAQKVGDVLTITYDDGATTIVNDGDPGVGIASIDRAGDTVTVTYDNAETSQFTLLDGVDSVYGDGDPVTTQTISKNSDTGVYTAQYLDFDFTFRQGSTTVASARYRLTRSGDTWSTTATQQSSPTPTNASRLTPTVTVAGTGATLKVTYSYNGLVSSASIPASIVITGATGEDGITSLIYNWTGSNTWPTNTTIDNADVYSFESQFEGRVIIKIQANDAEGGSRLSFNDGEAIPFSRTGPDGSTEWYQFDLDGLVVGTNTIKIWSSTGDGGAIYAVQVALTGVPGSDGVRGTAVLTYSADLGSTATSAVTSSSLATYWNSVASAAYVTEIAGDTLVVTNTNTNAGWTHIYAYNGTSWESDTAFTVNGSMIVDGTITANNMVISDFSGNLIGNGSFAYGDARGWQYPLPSTALTTIFSSRTCFGLDTASVDVTVRWNTDVPVIPGEELSVRFFGAASSGGSATLRINVAFYRADGSYISGYWSLGATFNTTVWTEYNSAATTITVPNNAAVARFHIRRAAGGSGTGYITGIEAVRKRSGTTVITPNSITAEHLSVNSLDAISANIGTFQSATTGARLVIQDDKIMVYDANGNIRVKIGNLT